MHPIIMYFPSASALSSLFQWIKLLAPVLSLAVGLCKHLLAIWPWSRPLCTLLIYSYFLLSKLSDNSILRLSWGFTEESQQKSNKHTNLRNNNHSFAILCLTSFWGLHFCYRCFTQCLHEAGILTSVATRVKALERSEALHKAEFIAFAECTWKEAPQPQILLLTFIFSHISSYRWLQACILPWNIVPIVKCKT